MSHSDPSPFVLYALLVQFLWIPLAQFKPGSPTLPPRIAIDVAGGGNLINKCQVGKLKVGAYLAFLEARSMAATSIHE